MPEGELQKLKSMEVKDGAIFWCAGRNGQAKVEIMRKRQKVDKGNSLLLVSEHEARWTR